jgi:hypothetical protein
MWPSTWMHRIKKFALEEVVGTNAPYVVAFEIQQGHYDITGLSNEIQRLLNIYTHGTGSPYTVSSITSQNKVIFRAVAPVTRFRLRFDLDDNCSGLLGFGNDATPFNDTVVSTDSMYAKALLSPAYVDTSGEHCVFITSPELGTNFHEVSYQKTHMGLVNSMPANSFGKIALAGAVGSLVIYTPSTNFPIFKEFRPPIGKLDQLTIRWLRRDSSRVDFKGLDNSLQLQFKSVTRSSGQPNFGGFF